MKSVLTLFSLVFAGAGLLQVSKDKSAGKADLSLRPQVVIPERKLRPLPEAKILRVEGPFPENDSIAITSVTEDRDSTFLRLRLKKDKATVHKGHGFSYEVVSGGQAFPLLSLNGGTQNGIVDLVRDQTFLLEFERFPLDASFDLLEGGRSAPLDNKDYMHLLGVNLAANGRNSRSLKSGAIHGIPAISSQKVRLVRYEEGRDGIGLTLNFSQGGVWSPGWVASYLVRQDGKTYRMNRIEGPNRKEVTDSKHASFGRGVFYFAPPEVRGWFEPFDITRPFDLLEGKEGAGSWHFRNINLSRLEEEYPEYAASTRRAYDAIAARNDCDAWIAEFALNDPHNLAPSVPSKRQEAFLRELQNAGLTTRTGFKQGKIGERYVPDIKYYTSSSDSFTVNNQSYTVTKGDTNYSSGWKEGIEGYTAIWGIRNASTTTPFVVEVAVNGTSTFNPMVKDSAMWSGSESRKRITQKNVIRLVKRIFLMPEMDFKDQMVVGEEQPSDFKVEIQDFWAVDSTWASNFEKAMGTELKNRATAKTIHILLEKLKLDPIATAPNAWASDIASRLSKAERIIHEADLRDMKKDLDVNVTTASDFDPDFFSEVTAVLRNRSAYRYEVTFKKPDGNTERITVEPRGTATSSARVQRIPKGDLQVEILDIVAPADREFIDAPEPVSPLSQNPGRVKKSPTKKRYAP